MALLGLAPAVAAAVTAAMGAGATGYLGFGMDRVMMKWGGASCAAIALAGFYWAPGDEYVQQGLTAIASTSLCALGALHVKRTHGTAAPNQALAAQALTAVSGALALDQSIAAFRRRPLRS
jgi:hypothetical protein